eukprot:TRINITY_DN15286_c1_g1_i1.p6 TRINITY_DN15286_c1_g1~~TRINITY_DN15286_c1_g1_i1.p6  ORF type:complete len:125 (-),score=32.94 TRINITY_DN15286_c1_g1_i1:441-815(-)
MGQINNLKIFKFGEGEGGTYGLIWGLIFRKEKEKIQKIIENVQNSDNQEQIQPVFRQFLSSLRLLVVIQEITVESFGEQLKESEKIMRQNNLGSNLEVEKIEDEVRTECLRYLKIINSVSGKSD